jgi:TrmH family RNA methyltransferase
MSPTGLLKRISAVLCRPRYGGNIGAAARAVKNMGLGGLVLVAPEDYHLGEARMFASNALDVLEGAPTFGTIRESVTGCKIVLGASRRIKSHRIRIMTPREAAGHIIGNLGEGNAAILFGPEDNGLTSEELAQCHAVISIPADEPQPSLNLAQAVMVIAYELRMGVDGLPSVRSFGSASESEIGQMLDQASAVLEKSGFYIRNPKEKVLLHLKEIFYNGVCTSQDARIIRGIFRRIAWALGQEECADNMDPGE